MLLVLFCTPTPTPTQSNCWLFVFPVVYRQRAFFLSLFLTSIYLFCTVPSHVLHCSHLVVPAEQQVPVLLPHKRLLHRLRVGGLLGPVQAGLSLTTVALWPREVSEAVTTAGLTHQLFPLLVEVLRGCVIIIVGPQLIRQELLFCKRLRDFQANIFFPEMLRDFHFYFNPTS
jgi:hypothetical protein